MTQPLTQSADDGAAVVNSRTASNGHDAKDFRFDGNTDHSGTDKDDHDSLAAYRMPDSTGASKGAGPSGAQSDTFKSVGDRPAEDDPVARFGFPAGTDIFDFSAPDTTLVAQIGGEEKSQDSVKKATEPHSSEDSSVDKAMPETKGAAKRPNLEGMSKWFEDNFDNIDKDKDGVLSKTELDQGLLDPKLATGDGAIYLAAANGKTKDWATNFGPKVEGEEAPKPGITRESLTKMRDAVKSQDSKENQERSGISKIEGDMRGVDQNDDRCITKSELDEALKKDHWTKEQRESLENLQKRFTEVSKTTNDETPIIFTEDAAIPGTQYGLGLEEEFVSQLDLEKFNGDEGKFVDGLKDSIKDKVENRDSKHPVAQHGLDSCFLLAPLEALEKQEPGAMDKMIKDNGDGTVTVTFPGDPEKPVTIAKPTEGEQAEFTNGKAGIIEKAFADYVSKLPKEEQQKYVVSSAKEPPTLVQHKLDGGGLTEPAMSLLTGAESKGQEVKKMSEEQIVDTLTAATENHQLITIGTNPYTGGEGSGISPRHAYSVSFDPKTNTVTLTNPNKPNSGNPAEPTKPDHSPVDGKSDGSFTLTVEQFKQNVDHLFVGKPSK